MSTENDTKLDSTVADANGASVAELSHKGSSKRKLLQAAAVAPVVLMSGRSALACTGNQTGCTLSLATWLSAHPANGQTVALSHTAGGTPSCGKPPLHWKPNCKDYGGTKTFPTGCVWPSYVQPFGPYTCWDKTRNQYTTITYNKANCTKYTDLYHIDPTKRIVCGWDKGSRIGTMPKSASMHLIADINSIESHLCAAYLNACTYGSAYPLSTSDIEYIYANRCLPGNRPMTNSEIIAYCQSTYAA